jgi:hypothetical protein
LAGTDTSIHWKLCFVLAAHPRRGVPRFFPELASNLVVIVNKTYARNHVYGGLVGQRRAPFNAQRIGSFHLGMVAMRQNQRLSARQRKAAFRLGAAAVDPGALSAGDRLELAIAANFTDIKLVDIPIVGRLLRSD